MEVLSGRRQEQAFQTTGNSPYFELCDDCTRADICTIPSGGAQQIYAFYCMHVHLNTIFEIFKSII